MKYIHNFYCNISHSTINFSNLLSFQFLYPIWSNAIARFHLAQHLKTVVLHAATLTVKGIAKVTSE